MFKQFFIICGLITTESIAYCMEFINKSIDPQSSVRVHPINSSDDTIMVATVVPHKNITQVVPFGMVEHGQILHLPDQSLAQGTNRSNDLQEQIIQADQTDLGTMQLSLYDQELIDIQIHAHKNKSMIRAVTGTTSYQDQDGTTIIYNKITGTITYKNHKGQIVKELVKNANGTSKETIYSKKTSRIIDGKKITTSIIEQTTYATANILGKRTVQTHTKERSYNPNLDLTTTTSNNSIENYDATNQITSSMSNEKFITLYQNQLNQNIVIYYPDDTKQTISIDPSVPARAATKASGNYQFALNRFISEQVTDLTGSIINAIR